MRPQLLLLMLIAGAGGTLARYLLSTVVRSLVGSSFPWGTWSVNLLGCVFFGWVTALAGSRAALSDETRLILLVGFAGAFTTFSTLAFDTVELAREGRWLAAGVNVLAQNGLGCAAILLGLWLGRAR
jgi:fluoride exporter